MFILLSVLKCSWLFLPSGFANMMPIFAQKLFPKFEYPLDFNLTYKGVRIFGAHKTFRGLLAGVVISMVIFWFQKMVYLSFPSIRALSLIDYSEASVLFGGLFGVGTIMGDAIKSFFKRRVHIAPGNAWFPFDQIDWLIGSILVIIPFVSLSALDVITTITIGLLLHLLFKVLGYFMGFGKSLI